MIFCQYNYKSFHNDNTHKHPIQPYKLENWCKMVNDNYAYCQKFNWWKWVVFYFWFYIGRVKYCDLPSFHPHWKNEVKKDIRKTLDEIIIKYDECKENPEKIKYHFNSSTSLRDIEKRIEDYKCLIKEL